MMETEIMVGTGMKLTCSREDFVSRLAVVSRAVSTRSSVQILAGVLLRARRRRAAPRGDRHGALAANVARRAGRRRRAPSSCPGACSSTWRGCFPSRRCRSSIAPTRARAEHHVRRRELPAAHVQRGGLPAPARDRRDADLHRRRGGAARDRRAGLALGVARRVAPGADRHPRALRAGQARDGGHGLVSACRQGDGPPGVDAGARGDHPGARAHGARAHRRRRDAARGRRAGEPGRVPDRRRGADDASHRRPVPERQAAAARAVRARRDAAAERAARRRAARLGHGPAQLAAPPALLGGRARGVGADAGRRRGEGVAAGAVQPAIRSRSGSTRSSCATGSSRCSRTRCG